MKKFSTIKYVVRDWHVWVLAISISIYALAFSYFSILRHEAFYSGYDLANMDQTIWNTLYGEFFSLSRRATMLSRFSIHADPILIVLSPLYLLWNNVRMLLIAQSVFLALGCIPVYLLTEKILKNKTISLIVALVYLLNPSMHWTNMYDFHGVSLAITFLLSAFYTAYIKQWRWYVLFIFLALLTKESIALNIAMLGLVIVVFFKERRIGLFTIFTGVMWFFLTVFWLIPYFGREFSYTQHWALKWYQFGSEAEEIPRGLKVPTLQIIFFRFFQASDAFPYYLNLLKPYALMPLLGFPWLILALPTLTINMLSSHAQMRGVMLHYDSGITPFLTISTIFGLHYLKIFSSKTKLPFIYKRWVLPSAVIFLLVVAIRVSFRNSPLPYNPTCWCSMYEVSDADRAFEKLLQSIPASASVTASPEIRPHVTHRRNAYTVPNATASAQYIALIDQNRLVGDTNPKGFENILIEQLEHSDSYILVERIGHFYLYKAL